MAKIEKIADGAFRFTGDCNCFTYEFRPNDEGEIEVSSFKTSKEPKKRDDEKPAKKKKTGLFNELFPGEEKDGE